MQLLYTCIKPLIIAMGEFMDLIIVISTTLSICALVIILLQQGHWSWKILL